jgi:hypothetical protein
MVLTNEVVVSGSCCLLCNSCILVVLNFPVFGLLETKAVMTVSVHCLLFILLIVS